MDKFTRIIKYHDVQLYNNMKNEGHFFFMANKYKPKYDLKDEKNQLSE